MQPKPTTLVKTPGKAGVREQSTPRGNVPKSGAVFINPLYQRQRTIGQGTPSIAPVQATGSAGTPPSAMKRAESSPPRSRSVERSVGRGRTPPQIDQAVPIAPANRQVKPRSPLRRPSRGPDKPRVHLRPPSEEGGAGSLVYGASKGIPPTPSKPRSSSISAIQRFASSVHQRIGGWGRSVHLQVQAEEDRKRQMSDRHLEMSQIRKEKQKDEDLLQDNQDKLGLHLQSSVRNRERQCEEKNCGM